MTVTAPTGTRLLVPASGKRLLALLVFSPTCPHTATVAPEWARWTAGAPSDVDVLAITDDDRSGAVTYANTHRWDVEVGSIPRRDASAATRALLARTPWLFLVDRSGLVRFNTHGAHIALLDSAIAAQLDAPPSSPALTVLSPPIIPN